MHALVLIKNLFLLLLLITIRPTQADIIWHWQDQFSHSEQQKLITWVTQTVAGVERLVGPYPFNINVTFHRRSGSVEPVPWANTRRHIHHQGVHFHVNPEFSLKEFMNDWTAPHELSHLLIPYLGSEYSWFAEGFASYMQYQVMRELKIFNDNEILEKYTDHITGADAEYRYHQLSFAKAARYLRIDGKYPVMYWGGAIFFLSTDHALKKRKHPGMIALLSDFLVCCRRDRNNMQSLIRQFDRLSGTRLFRSHLVEFNNTPGFPDYSHLL